MKQDIRVYVTDSRSNGWIDWAKICCGNSRGWPGFFSKIFFFTRNAGLFSLFVYKTTVYFIIYTYLMVNSWFRRAI